MRTTRALIAGFGTTGTLVAAAACVFVVASAVVAFNGWSSLGIGDRIDSLFVKDTPTAASRLAGPQGVAGTAAAAAGTVAALPTGPVAASPGVGGGRIGPGANRTPGSGTSGDLQTGGGTAGAAGSGSGGGATGVPGVPNPGGATSGVGGAVQNTTHDVGGGLSNTTNQVGQSVGGVNQPLGNSVPQAGSGVGNAVSGLGDSAKGALPGQP